MKPGEWERRRDAAFVRLYAASLGSGAGGAKGRYFDDGDTFGWYLFLAEAFLDHIWNYEFVFGSRVVPVLATIGRDLGLLQAVDGLDERVGRIVGRERSQPNGGIFELLVAAAYKRAGATVAFRPECKGIAKSYDMDVILDGEEFAVECKRMETSAYGETERNRMRRLWGPASVLAEKVGVSVFGDVGFSVPLSDVPDHYLIDKVAAWLESGLPSMLWTDDFSRGVVGELDLEPLRETLETNEVLAAGTALLALLSGRYVRHANYLQSLRCRMGMTPRHIAECDLAILLRWETLAPASIDGKARDVLRKLAEANDQLPTDRPGIIHVGFEAVEGDYVERARYGKILSSATAFDPKGKPLRYVYCHYLSPESPPDEAWAYDETVQWVRITGTEAAAPHIPFLVVPKDRDASHGPHWDTLRGSTAAPQTA